jgi:uncharacterized damage-inducible protein DinB
MLRSPQRRTIVDEKALFLKFWAREAPTTRKVLSRIPEGSTYRPDAKSRPAGEIAWQIVCEEKVLVEGLVSGQLEWQDFKTPPTMKDVLDEYDRHQATALARLQALEPAAWERDIAFTYGGQELMRHTGYGHAWGFLFDIIHHRGQISTYLRPMGSTVPQIYGPTADEP